MVENNGGNNHSTGTILAVEVRRPSPGTASGFHVTRTQWDPYPWVSAVDAGSAAEAAGLRAGDCVLKVNGADVLGQRMTSVASRVRAQPTVTLLLWRAEAQHTDTCTESVCCGPMPTTLQRLSGAVAAMLVALECPVCLDTVQPPTHQCVNGHLVCPRCRPRTDRCPVCRVRMARGRSLLADNIFQALNDAFHTEREPDNEKPATLRERLFGRRKTERKTPAGGPTNKLLARIMGKSSSVENLSSIGKDFGSELRIKSLSTSELFRPAISSAPSSVHGSMESLVSEDEECGSLYHCPCSDNCPALLPANGIFQHARTCHGGPLVQYFKPQVSLRLPPQIEPWALLCISVTSTTYFLKVEDDSGDLAVWLWLLGSVSQANSVQLHVSIRSGNPNDKELHFVSPAFSLATSWQEVLKSPRGVISITDEVINKNFTDRKGLNLHVEVVELLGGQTPVQL